MPCIPYFGLYLKDLLHIEDGNESLVTNAAGVEMINFEKMRMLASVLDSIDSFQQMARRYNLQPVPQIRRYLVCVSRGTLPLSPSPLADQRFSRAGR